MVRAILQRPNVARDEPLLEPLFRARALIRSAEEPWEDVQVRWFMAHMIRGVVGYFLFEGVAQHRNWLRVPVPSAQLLEPELAAVISAYEFCDQAVFSPEQARELAVHYADLLIEMWPAVPYLVIDRLMVEDPDGVIELVWVKDDLLGTSPKAVRRTSRSRADRTDVADRLWEEAAVLLLAQGSKGLNPWLLEKARAISCSLLRSRTQTPSGGRIADMAEGGVSRLRERNLIAARPPVGDPDKAGGYVYGALRYEVQNVPAPDMPPPPTIRRWIAQGRLPKGATRAEILAYRGKADKLKRHQVSDYPTKRQLATKLGVSLRQIDNAIREELRVTGKSEPRDESGPQNRPFCFDPVWEAAITARLVSWREDWLEQLAMELGQDVDALREIDAAGPPMTDPRERALFIIDELRERRGITTYALDDENTDDYDSTG